MEDLITRVRSLIYDPEGASAIFSDDEIQDALDDHRNDVRYLELKPAETIQSGGSISYLEYHAGRPDWEGTVTLLNASYGTLSPSSANYRRGVFNFSSNQDPPVMIVGQTYNLYAASVDLLKLWKARLKLQFDFTADGSSFKLSQQLKSLDDLIVQYENKAGIETGIMLRGDVNIYQW